MRMGRDNYELVFGSNLILKCGKAVELIGKGINEQIIRFREGEDGRILFNCTIKDENKITVAEIADSRAQHLREGYKADISKDTIKIVKESTGDVWLEFARIGWRKFRLNGRFFLPGYKIIATDDYLEINANRVSDAAFENCSAAIGIG